MTQEILPIITKMLPWLIAVISAYYGVLIKLNTKADKKELQEQETKISKDLLEIKSQVNLIHETQLVRMKASEFKKEIMQKAISDIDNLKTRCDKNEKDILILREKLIK